MASVSGLRLGLPRRSLWSCHFVFWTARFPPPCSPWVTFLPYSHVPGTELKEPRECQAATVSQICPVREARPAPSAFLMLLRCGDEWQAGGIPCCGLQGLHATVELWVSCAAGFTCSSCRLPQASVRLTEMEGPACKSRAVPLGKQRQVAGLVWFWCSYSFWMWGSKVDFEYLNARIPWFPFPTPHLFTPMLAERLCGTCIEMLAMILSGVSLPATALRSPDSGVTLPLLVSPLISYGNDAFRPCTRCPHRKLHQDRQRCPLWSIIFLVATLSIFTTLPVTTWFPTAAVH